MAKDATVWIPANGQGDVSSDNSGSYLKINSTDYLLLAGTDKLLLGHTVLTPKDSTVWSAE